MTHDEAFLHAIRATPSDDAPRLIYADWLEEQGQTDRAEFIRIQCQLARMAEANPAWTALRNRAEELLRNHWAEWVGALADIVGPWCDRYGEHWMRAKFHPDGLKRFPRGFVERLSMEAGDYLRHARTLNRLTPLRQLLLWGGGRCMAQLAQEPTLAGLSALGFTDYYDAPLRANDAATLACSPHLNGLRMLLLGWNSLGDEGVKALAQARWLVGVTFLDLSDNGLSDRAAVALAKSPYLGNLRTLLLNKNTFSAASIEALTSSANLRHLRRLEYDPPTNNGSSVGSCTP
jgi:uncharacterized protein (TIGR02996 family)